MFSLRRIEDAEAISDLAIYNYSEVITYLYIFFHLINNKYIFI